MNYIFLVIGFVLLVKGADFFVEGSSNLALYLKVPPLFIGLTVVSIGTSMPEIVVSLVASINNSNEIAISNSLGSNIFNILVVLGSCSIIKTLTTKKEIIRDFIILIISTLFLLVFSIDNLLSNTSSNLISKTEGLILLLGFLLYMYILFKSNKKNNHLINENYSLKLEDILTLILGFSSVIIGGEIVVKFSRIIARSYNISETIIGLTIISIGTSLPELITSLIAAKKGKNDIAIGNVIGSNIFNILIVLGLSSTVNNIYVNKTGIIDIFISLVITLVCFKAIIKKKKITRKNGVFMLIIYILFLIFVVYR